MYANEFKATQGLSVYLCSVNCVIDHIPPGIFEADSDVFNVCIVYLFVYQISPSSYGCSERRRQDDGEEMGLFAQVRDEL